MVKAANAFSRVSQSFCCKNIGLTPLITAENRFFVVHHTMLTQ